MSRRCDPRFTNSVIHSAVDILQDDYGLAHSLFTSCAVQVATARPLRRAASNTRADLVKIQSEDQ